MIRDFKTFKRMMNENNSLNEQKLRELTSLNYMLRKQYQSGNLSIADFECWDAALVVYHYCKNMSKKFLDPRIWTCKTEYHAFVVAFLGTKQVTLDVVALNQTHLGDPIKLTTDVRSNPNYGNGFEMFTSADEYRQKNASSINIGDAEIIEAARELEFLG